MSEKMNSPAEFAGRVEMTEQWVRRRIRSGDIAAIRLGKYIRIPESEVARLLSEGTAPVADTAKSGS